MDKVMYVIAQLGHPSRTLPRFISTLEHEFKGEKEVLGYSNLDEALKFESREIAKKCLKELPNWAKDKHAVHSVRQTAYGWDYCSETPRVYKDFVLKTCNDGCSCDILCKDSWNLICIVGSVEKAIAWVDDWYVRQSSSSVNDQQIKGGIYCVRFCSEAKTFMKNGI